MTAGRQAEEADQRAAAAIDSAAELEHQVVDLRAEYVEDLLGTEVARPRLSWRIEAEARDTVQARYRVRAAASRNALREATALLWDSGEVASAAALDVAYAGAGGGTGRGPEPYALSLRPDLSDPGHRVRGVGEGMTWSETAAAGGWDAPEDEDAPPDLPEFSQDEALFDGPAEDAGPPAPASRAAAASA